MHHAVGVGVVVEDRAGDVVREPLAIDFNHAVALAVLVRRHCGGLWAFEHRVVAEAVDDLGSELRRETGVAVVAAKLVLSDDGAGGAVAEFHRSTRWRGR